MVLFLYEHDHIGRFSNLHLCIFKDFFSKCDQIRSKLRISSYLLKKSLTENFIFVQCKIKGEILNFETTSWTKIFADFFTF